MLIAAMHKKTNVITLISTKFVVKKKYIQFEKWNLVLEGEIGLEKFELREQTFSTSETKTHLKKFSHFQFEEQNHQSSSSLAYGRVMFSSANTSKQL